METIKREPSKIAQWEKLRRELLRKIIQNEARRRAARNPAPK